MTRKIIYFKGDKAEFTGNNNIELYGGVFDEIKMLEGHMKNELKLIKSTYDCDQCGISYPNIQIAEYCCKHLK